MLSGPPGVGKSTVARLLADGGKLGDAVVRLHTDDFWGFIRRGAVPPFLPEARRQNATVVGVIAGAAVGYAAGGYEVVVDGVVGPWFVDVYREAARAAGVAAHYAVLRPDERTTLERGTTRTDHPLTDPGPIRAMYAQFTDLGPYEPHALDTTGLTAEESAEAMREALEAGHLRLA